PALRIAEATERLARARLASGGLERAFALHGHELSFQRLAPRTRLVLCGAGDEAVPLAALAAGLGWDVLAVDHRPAYARDERFPDARAVLIASPRDVAT